MIQPIYFNGVATNPVHLAEINVGFYTWYVSDWGYSPNYKDLWVGQTLRDFIIRFLVYAEGTESITLKKRAKELHGIYNSLLSKLSGEKVVLKAEKAKNKIPVMPKAKNGGFRQPSQVSRNYITI